MNTSIKKTSSNKEFAKNCIMDALLQLMHTKDYEQISISELARKAGVSRMSYYRNYNSKDEILMDYMYQIILEYAQELDLSNIRPGVKPYQHILHTLK